MTLGHTHSAHLTLQLIGKMVRSGTELTDGDIYSLRLIKGYCEAMLAGESVEPSDIYNRVFGKDAA